MGAALVESRADLDREDRAGQTPLAYAASMRSEPCTRVLLVHGANFERILQQNADGAGLVQEVLDDLRLQAESTGHIASASADLFAETGQTMLGGVLEDQRADDGRPVEDLAVSDPLAGTGQTVAGDASKQLMAEPAQAL